MADTFRVAVLGACFPHRHRATADQCFHADWNVIAIDILQESSQLIIEIAGDDLATGALLGQFIKAIKDE